MPWRRELPLDSSKEQSSQYQLRLCARCVEELSEEEIRNDTSVLQSGRNLSESSKERYSASPATDGFAAKVAMQCTDVDQTHAEYQIL